MLNKITHLAYFSCGVEQPLQRIAQKYTGPEGNPHRFDSIHDGTDNVRGCLETIGPNEIEQVGHRVFASESSHAEREMLHYGARSLAMDEVAIGQRIFQHGDDRITVECRLGTDVLEHEGEGLETTGSHVEFARTIFVEDSRYASESYEIVRWFEYEESVRTSRAYSRPQVSATIAVGKGRD